MPFRFFQKRDLFLLPGLGIFVFSLTVFIVCQRSADKFSPGHPKKVVILCTSWANDEWLIRNLADAYNREHHDHQIVIELRQPPLAKLRFLKRKGRMIWNGMVGNAPFLDMARNANSKLTQPMEPYIRKSKVRGADKVFTDMIPSILEDNSYQGQLYSLPGGIDLTCITYRADYLAEVGYQQFPETWAEVSKAAQKVMEKKRDEKVFGIGFTVKEIWHGVAALQQSFTTKPFTSDGLLDITGEAWLKAMRLEKSWIDAGLCPRSIWETWEVVDTFRKGKLAILIHQNSTASWARQMQELGVRPEDVKLARFPTDGGGKGTVFWTSCFDLLDGAPYPQETVDFILWAFGPEGDKGNRNIFRAGKLTGYRSAYKRFVKNKGEFAWAKDLYGFIEESVPAPKNTFYELQNDIIVPWLRRYLVGKTGALEAMEKARAEIEWEIARMQRK